jgi:hypothetical protein
MSPTHHNPEFEKPELDGEDRFDTRNPGGDAFARNTIQRTKRIRSARRANSANGIQRRRNKRIDW